MSSRSLPYMPTPDSSTPTAPRNLCLPPTLLSLSQPLRQVMEVNDVLIYGHSEVRDSRTLPIVEILTRCCHGSLKRVPVYMLLLDWRISGYIRWWLRQPFKSRMRGQIDTCAGNLSCGWKPILILSFVHYILICYPYYTICYTHSSASPFSFYLNQLCRLRTVYALKSAHGLRSSTRAWRCDMLGTIILDHHSRRHTLGSTLGSTATTLTRSPCTISSPDPSMFLCASDPLPGLP